MKQEYILLERPSHPEGDFLWSLMNQCWRINPKDRPAFTDLVQELFPICTNEFQVRII